MSNYCILLIWMKYLFFLLTAVQSAGRSARRSPVCSHVRRRARLRVSRNLRISDRRTHTDRKRIFRLSLFRLRIYFHFFLFYFNSNLLFAIFIEFMVPFDFLRDRPFLTHFSPPTSFIEPIFWAWAEFGPCFLFFISSFFNQRWRISDHYRTVLKSKTE